ncbi:beta-galactosidase trimerization domain-containing protein (plasmid) [Cetobacterium somerae]|uniref:beta-galactosidase trimerization domain-containing protein n=1 Tax=Cetobacterium somerae TaxID=188913 RepID=UPI001F059303|nr:beta-galactosidase trimerization domain-containing protein [Cetobacterium somerae]UPO98699.1 beta-galactosidase trimerization domain-containing protein [Cetobacterium somerae]
MKKEIQRQIHLDFHTSEFIEDIGIDFDPTEFGETLKNAHVNSVTLFARCHHGWLYYPSKKYPHLIHPNLKNKNLLIEQIEVCHKQGIKTPIYTTVQWDGRVMRENPEWLSLDENGEFIDTQNIPKPHFYNTICLNTEYRQFFKEHLEDIVSSVGKDRIDGFFLDILFKVDCNCKQCQEKMKALNMDIYDKEERLIYSSIMLDEFRREIATYIENLVPGKSLFFNSSHVGPNFKKALDVYSHLELESLPSGGWGYDHFPATVRYARNLGKDIIGMTGKFHTYWGDFHSYKNLEALEFECFNMLTLGAGCSIGDQLHNKGQLSLSSYDLIGKVYEQIERKEEFCTEITPMSEIALLTPEESYSSNESGIDPGLIGAMRILQEMSYQFEIIDSSMDFYKYKVLILPDKIEFNITLKNKLENYMKNGGKIISSYISLIDTSNENNLFSLKYLGESEFDRDFILPNEKIGRSLPKEEHVMYLKGIKVEAINSEVVLETIEPYFNREGIFFCSHQHAPSSGKKGFPGALKGNNYIYFSHPIFRIYRKNGAKWCKEILKDSLEMLLDKKLVDHNGPTTLITSLNEQKNENRIILHLLNYLIEKPSQDIYTIQNKLKLYELEVKVNIPDKKIVSIFEEETREEIPFEQNGQIIKFKINSVNGHHMTIFNYEN